MVRQAVPVVRQAHQPLVEGLQPAVEANEHTEDVLSMNLTAMRCAPSSQVLEGFTLRIAGLAAGGVQCATYNDRADFAL